MKEFWKSSESNEWYTPPKYVECVRLALGGSIGLDPASCSVANKIIQAQRIFTQSQDGLLKIWETKTLFMNPPYGRSPGVRFWLEKALTEYQTGNFQKGILLVLSKTGEKWFQPLWDFPLCFTNHRVKYLPGVGNSRNSAGTIGSCFVYLGTKPHIFDLYFKEIGHIVLPGK